MRYRDGNTHTQRKLWNRSDGILILSLLVLAVCGYLGYSLWAGWADRNRSGEMVCDIYLDGQLVRTVSLDQPQEFSLPEKPEVLFQIKDNKIAFIRSDCPDKVCVHTGFLRHSGQSAACLPNRLLIRLRGGDGPDAVVG